MPIPHRHLPLLCRALMHFGAGVLGLALLAPAWAQAPATELFAAMRLAAVATMPSLAKPAAAEPGSGIVPLLDCLDPGIDLGVNESDRDDFPIMLAMYIEQSQRSLRALGIPDPVWQPTLDRWARLAERYLADVQAQPARSEALRQGADRASREAGEALLRDVNRYRRQRQPRAAEVVLMDGCGAGEMPVNIQTRPAGGQVTYIPLFRFRLCEARGLAPQDPRACRGWVNVSKPEEFLSGLYAYVVRWPDGQLSTGVFDTEKARINDRSGSDVAHVLLTR